MKNVNSKNKILSLITFLLFVAGNGYSQKLKDSTEISGQYTVKGKISDVKDCWVYMCHSDRFSKNIKIDSTKLKNGEFEFTGNIDGVEAIILGLPVRDSKGNFVPQSKEYRGPIMLSKGNLFITGNYNSRTNLLATGTAAQDEYNIFRNKTEQLNDRLNVITGKFYNTKIKEEIDKLNNEYRNLSNTLVQAAKNHVISYPNSITSAYIAKSTLVKADVSILKEVYELFTPAVKNSVYGKEVKQLYQKAMFLEIGNDAPLFTLPDKDGNAVSLSSFKGNYVLIDFWASWCAPCRREHPNLIKLNESYKNKGLKILSISMDKRKELWLKAIVEDKLTWTQLSDLKALDSEVGNNYGIKILPTNFLIDKEGRIIAKNLNETDLSSKLKELYSL
jgi:peroxiredoxin